jgi:2-polyprenyl-6-methoxyphenol hydroxylase-like FAD-dependent oxidoreductase
MLTQLALSVGVKISYSSPVTAVYPPSSPTSSQKVRVEVSRHEQLVADVVVAADGGDSTIRKMVIEELEEVDSGMSVFT